MWLCTMGRDNLTNQVKRQASRCTASEMSFWSFWNARAKSVKVFLVLFFLSLHSQTSESNDRIYAIFQFCAHGKLNLNLWIEEIDWTESSHLRTSVGESEVPGLWFSLVSSVCTGLDLNRFTILRTAWLDMHQHLQVWPDFISLGISHFWQSQMGTVYSDLFIKSLRGQNKPNSMKYHSKLICWCLYALSQQVWTWIKT